MTASIEAIFDAVDGTWPASAFSVQGPWTLRAGDGGGKRVSAATARGPVSAEDITDAEAAMLRMGQTPLFSLRPEDTELDSALADLGYEVRDPSTIYACYPDALTDVAIPPVTIFSIWDPLAIMVEIWEQGGIGPARQRVMDRAPGPKTGLLCRMDEKPGGVAFVAMHEGTAMVHALEVLPHQRRKGVAQWLMRGAAFWAAAQDAHTLSVICTQANAPANALYASLGFSVVGQYHYRLKTEETS